MLKKNTPIVEDTRFWWKNIIVKLNINLSMKAGKILNHNLHNLINIFIFGSNI